MAARQRHRLMAAGSDRRRFAGQSRPLELRGRVSDSGEGRWTVQAAIDEGVPAPVISAALFSRFASRGRGEFAAQLLSAMRFEFGGHKEKSAGSRRSLMPRFQSDAFVFFGATGDLAYKQIFPSLQGLIRDEGFNLPIIGVAKAGWNLDQFKARAKDSLEKNGGLDQEHSEADGPFALCGRRLQRSGDLHRAPKAIGAGQAAVALSGHSAQFVWHCRRRPGQIGLRRKCARGDRETVWARSGLGTGTGPHSAPLFPRRKEFSGSIISSAKNRCRTFSTRASPTRCSSRSGTATMFAAFRSPWPRSSGLKIAASSMTKPVRSVMWCRIICCRFSPSSPWIRPLAKTMRRSAIRKPRC